MSAKIKVVWICHFSNQEIQNILKPLKKIGEMAPWIPSLAKIFEDQDIIELNIISPHEYISKYKQVKLRGIHYHFFNAHIPLWGRHWPGILKIDDWTDFRLNKFIVKKIVKKIKPDIIHLQGAENAYYSSTIFQFKNEYPILITLQGFLHKVSSTNPNKQIKKKIECELNIYKTFKHFGYRTTTMGQVVKEINPDIVLHKHGYGIKVSVNNINTVNYKKYDLVFFAAITRIKGIEDLFKAISLLKINKSDIKALIIGKANNDYLIMLKELTNSLGIENNITWAGFLPTQQDVHNAALDAKICVLPVQYYMIPGTIIESMLLKIPVVSYNVGSIHEINEKEEVIALVEKDNIAGLVEAISRLLNDEELYRERAEKGYIRAIEILDNNNVLDDLLLAYNDVIEDFNKK
jgi:glycosyltransferase involved in cell wall biosynthesis